MGTDASGRFGLCANATRTRNANAHGANLTGTVSPMPVTLIIGDDSGMAPVQALMFR
jgi:hypothetical protein